MAIYTTYGCSYSSAPPDFATILGANYYEDWNSEIGVSDTGGLADSWTSQGLNGGVFASSGSSRPSVITDVTLGKDVLDFDGVSEYMQVSGSTADYNFLHNSSGGCVILVTNQNTTPSPIGLMIGNYISSSQVGARIQTNSSGTFTQVVANGSSNIVINISAAFDNNKYQSLVNIFDSGNVTLSERGNIVNNGVDNKNNSTSGTPSASAAFGSLTLAKAVSSSFYFSGQFARIIIADTIPTPTQLAQIQTRLEYEYGTFPIS